MDVASATSIAALVVALLAFLIAFGQIVQQYAASGQLIRVCDSVVYGGHNGLPGRGRRLWDWRQFRFRVLYTVPKLVIIAEDPKIRAALGLQAKETRTSYPLRQISGHRAVGEASWVSLARALFNAKRSVSMVGVINVYADADRCPPDLPNVPMPVSMRDMVVFGLFLGLSPVEASLQRRSLIMDGSAASVITTQHPVLGPLMRFERKEEDGKLQSQRDDSSLPTVNWLLNARGFWSSIKRMSLRKNPDPGDPNGAGLIHEAMWDYLCLMESNPGVCATPLLGLMKSQSDIIYELREIVCRELMESGTIVISPVAEDSEGPQKPTRLGNTMVTDRHSLMRLFNFPHGFKDGPKLRFAKLEYPPEHVRNFDKHLHVDISHIDEWLSSQWKESHEPRNFSTLDLISPGTAISEAISMILERQRSPESPRMSSAAGDTEDQFNDYWRKNLFVTSYQEDEIISEKRFKDAVVDRLLRPNWKHWKQSRAELQADMHGSLELTDREVMKLVVIVRALSIALRIILGVDTKPLLEFLEGGDVKAYVI